MLQKSCTKTSPLLILFLLSSFFTGLSYAQTGKPGDKKSVAIGKKLYQQNCQVCHLKNGVGERPISPYIRLPGYVTAMPLNDSSHAWHHSDQQIVHTILNGTRASKRMPAWKDKLSEQQAREIVAYLKSLWSPRILACQGGPNHMSCKP